MSGHIRAKQSLINPHDHQRQRAISHTGDVQAGVIPQTGEKKSTDIIVVGEAGIIYVERDVIPDKFTL